MFRIRQLRFQTKIVLVLVAVILPTFLLVTVIENKLTQPILEKELEHIGVTAGEALAAEILNKKLLAAGDKAGWGIEREILERLYSQPNIIRMDVFVKDGNGPKLKLLASNVEDEPSVPTPLIVLNDKVTSELKNEDGIPFWNITVPIKQETAHAKPGGGISKTNPRVLGMVHLIVSTRSVNRILGVFAQVTGIGAAVSVVVLILVLNYFLSKTIENERLLRKAENQNLELSQQLHEAQRQMMNIEKMAVMGQLTASFAHEIGTPLNAIGGHLQLLREDFPNTAEQTRGPSGRERLEIITGELTRIEQIVKAFLQTTAKPVYQRQLVDLNRIVNKTVDIVRPRMDALGLDLRCRLDSKLGPLRLVPTDIEQILLNLANNSLDSLKSKVDGYAKAKLQLDISTELKRTDGEDWAEIIVYDSGVGIKKNDLKQVLKPFFTTKRPGEGTGLGLTICAQLAARYGGQLQLESKDGSWTEVRLRLPYRANV